VPAYSDNRSLLAETRPKAAYLATPPMAAADTIATCAERGIHVWKELPLARSLDEGVRIVRCMDEAGLRLAVGTQRRFAAGYRSAWRWRHEVGEVFLARAHYLFNWGPVGGWRADAASAGGGALLEVAYHPIDLLVWMLGLPESVHGLVACGSRPDQKGPQGQPLPPYDTDDTAAILLRYPARCMALVATTRRSGPVSEELNIYGNSGSLTANAESCLLRDPDGNLLDRAEDKPDKPELAVYRRQAESFAKAVLAGSTTYECSARENLLDLAVIEAAYLSSRTGQPESPLPLLKARNLTVDDCLRHRPIPSGD
jgi:predicted dehydrogenase